MRTKDPQLARPPLGTTQVAGGGVTETQVDSPDGKLLVHRLTPGDLHAGVTSEHQQHRQLASGLVD
jgi:hypothetical protein